MLSERMVCLIPLAASSPFAVTVREATVFRASQALCQAKIECSPAGSPAMLSLIAKPALSPLSAVVEIPSPTTRSPSDAIILEYTALFQLPLSLPLAADSVNDKPVLLACNCVDAPSDTVQVTKSLSPVSRTLAGLRRTRTLEEGIAGAVSLSCRPLRLAGSAVATASKTLDQKNDFIAQPEPVTNVRRVSRNKHFPRVACTDKERPRPNPRNAGWRTNASERKL